MEEMEQLLGSEPGNEGAALAVSSQSSSPSSAVDLSASSQSLQLQPSPETVIIINSSQDSPVLSSSEISVSSSTHTRKKKVGRPKKGENKKNKDSPETSVKEKIVEKIHNATVWDQLGVLKCTKCGFTASKEYFHQCHICKCRKSTPSTLTTSDSILKTQALSALPSTSLIGPTAQAKSCTVGTSSSSNAEVTAAVQSAASVTPQSASRQVSPSSRQGIISYLPRENAYKCMQCGFQGCDTAFIEHLMYQVFATPYHCQYCKKSFSERLLLHRHFELEHPSQKKKCKLRKVSTITSIMENAKLQMFTSFTLHQAFQSCVKKQLPQEKTNSSSTPAQNVAVLPRSGHVSSTAASTSTAVAIVSSVTLAAGSLIPSLSCDLSTTPEGRNDTKINSSTALQNSSLAPAAKQISLLQITPGVNLTSSHVPVCTDDTVADVLDENDGTHLVENKSLFSPGDFNGAGNADVGDITQDADPSLPIIISCQGNYIDHDESLDDANQPIVNANDVPAGLAAATSLEEHLNPLEVSTSSTVTVSLPSVAPVLACSSAFVSCMNTSEAVTVNVTSSASLDHAPLPHRSQLNDHQVVAQIKGNPSVTQLAKETVPFQTYQPISSQSQSNLMNVQPVHNAVGLQAVGLLSNIVSQAALQTSHYSLPQLPQTAATSGLYGPLIASQPLGMGSPTRFHLLPVSQIISNNDQPAVLRQVPQLQPRTTSVASPLPPFNPVALRAGLQRTTAVQGTSFRSILPKVGTFLRFEQAPGLASANLPIATCLEKQPSEVGTSESENTFPNYSPISPASASPGPIYTPISPASPVYTPISPASPSRNYSPISPPLPQNCVRPPAGANTLPFSLVAAQPPVSTTCSVSVHTLHHASRRLDFVSTPLTAPQTAVLVSEINAVASPPIDSTSSTSGSAVSEPSETSCPLIDSRTSGASTSESGIREAASPPVDSATSSSGSAMSQPKQTSSSNSSESGPSGITNPCIDSAPALPLQITVAATGTGVNSMKQEKEDTEFQQPNLMMPTCPLSSSAKVPSGQLSMPPHNYFIKYKDSFACLRCSERFHDNSAFYIHVWNHQHADGKLCSKCCKSQNQTSSQVSCTETTQIVNAVSAITNACLLDHLRDDCREKLSRRLLSGDIGDVCDPQENNEPANIQSSEGAAVQSVEAAAEDTTALTVFSSPPHAQIEKHSETADETPNPVTVPAEASSELSRDPVSHLMSSAEEISSVVSESELPIVSRDSGEENTQNLDGDAERQLELGCTESGHVHDTGKGCAVRSPGEKEMVTESEERPSTGAAVLSSTKSTAPSTEADGKISASGVSLNADGNSTDSSEDAQPVGEDVGLHVPFAEPCLKDTSIENRQITASQELRLTEDSDQTRHRTQTVAGEKLYDRSAVFFICSLCDFSSALAIDFTMHLDSSHHSEQIFPCYHCHYQGKYTTDLTNHISTHTEGDSKMLYLCPCASCSYRTGNLKALGSHIRCHPGSTFWCHNCHTPFEDDTDLLEHLTQNSMTLFGCSMCASRFLNKLAIQRHLKTEHSGVLAFRVMKVLLCKERKENNYKLPVNGLPIRRLSAEEELSSHIRVNDPDDVPPLQASLSLSKCSAADETPSKESNHSDQFPLQGSTVDAVSCPETSLCTLSEKLNVGVNDDGLYANKLPLSAEDTEGSMTTVASGSNIVHHHSESDSPVSALGLTVEHLEVPAAASCDSKASDQTKKKKYSIEKDRLETFRRLATKIKLVKDGESPSEPVNVSDSPDDSPSCFIASFEKAGISCVSTSEAEAGESGTGTSFQNIEVLVDTDAADSPVRDEDAPLATSENESAALNSVSTSEAEVGESDTGTGFQNIEVLVDTDAADSPVRDEDAPLSTSENESASLNSVSTSKAEVGESGTGTGFQNIEVLMDTDAADSPVRDEDAPLATNENKSAVLNSVSTSEAKVDKSDTGTGFQNIEVLVDADAADSPVRDKDAPLATSENESAVLQDIMVDSCDETTAKGSSAQCPEKPEEDAIPLRELFGSDELNRLMFNTVYFVRMGMYYCQICEAKIHSEKLVQEHLFGHYLPLVKCNQCWFSCSLKVDLVKHFGTNHQGKEKIGLNFMVNKTILLDQLMINEPLTLKKFGNVCHKIDPKKGGTGHYSSVASVQSPVKSQLLKMNDSQASYLEDTDAQKSNSNTGLNFASRSIVSNKTPAACFHGDSTGSSAPGKPAESKEPGNCGIKSSISSMINRRRSSGHSKIGGASVDLKKQKSKEALDRPKPGTYQVVKIGSMSKLKCKSCGSLTISPASMKRHLETCARYLNSQRDCEHTTKAEFLAKNMKSVIKSMSEQSPSQHDTKFNEPKGEILSVSEARMHKEQSDGKTKLNGRRHGPWNPKVHPETFYKLGVSRSKSLTETITSRSHSKKDLKRKKLKRPSVIVSSSSEDDLEPDKSDSTGKQQRNRQLESKVEVPSEEKDSVQKVKHVKTKRSTRTLDSSTDEDDDLAELSDKQISNNTETVAESQGNEQETRTVSGNNNIIVCQGDGYVEAGSRNEDVTDIDEENQKAEIEQICKCIYCAFSAPQSHLKDQQEHMQQKHPEQLKLVKCGHCDYVYYPARAGNRLQKHTEKDHPGKEQLKETLPLSYFYSVKEKENCSPTHKMGSAANILQRSESAPEAKDIEVAVVNNESTGMKKNIAKRTGPKVGCCEAASSTPEVTENLTKQTMITAGTKRNSSPHSDRVSEESLAFVMPQKRARLIDSEEESTKPVSALSQPEASEEKRHKTSSEPCTNQSGKSDKNTEQKKPPPLKDKPLREGQERNTLVDTNQEISADEFVCNTKNSSKRKREWSSRESRRSAAKTANINIQAQVKGYSDSNSNSSDDEFDISAHKKKSAPKKFKRFAFLDTEEFKSNKKPPRKSASNVSARLPVTKKEQRSVERTSVSSTTASGSDPKTSSAVLEGSAKDKASAEKQAAAQISAASASPSTTVDDSRQKTHKKQGEGVVSYVCVLCGQRHIDLRKISAHLTRHLNYCTIPCSWCSEEFLVVDDAKAHHRSMHKDKDFVMKVIRHPMMEMKLAKLIQESKEKAQKKATAAPDVPSVQEGSSTKISSEMQSKSNVVDCIRLSGYCKQSVQCRECQSVHDSVSEFKDHYDKTHADNGKQKEWMDVRTQNVYNLRGTLIQEGTDMNAIFYKYMCALCSFRCNTREQIKKHKAEAHPDKGQWSLLLQQSILTCCISPGNSQHNTASANLPSSSASSAFVTVSPSPSLSASYRSPAVTTHSSQPVSVPSSSKALPGGEDVADQQETAEHTHASACLSGLLDQHSDAGRDNAGKNTLSTAAQRKQEVHQPAVSDLKLKSVLRVQLKDIILCPTEMHKLLLDNGITRARLGNKGLSSKDRKILESAKHSL